MKILQQFQKSQKIAAAFVEQSGKIVHLSKNVCDANKRPRQFFENTSEIVLIEIKSFRIF